MEDKEMWTIDELTSLTTTVQSAEIEYQGKVLPVQWCELIESEEPKMSMAPEGVDENQHYAEIASERISMNDTSERKKFKVVYWHKYLKETV